MFDSMTTSALMASMFWGALAGGFLLYGWRQKVLLPFLAGAALTIISYYFLSSALYMSLASVAVLAGFFWLKKQGY
jgi:hypothetical protein